MGAGQYAAYGRAGADPELTPQAVVPPFMPRAMFFDPRVKQFILFSASGQPIDVHPVDQIVALRLFIERGSSPSATTLGNRIRARTNRMDPQKTQQIALEEARSVLQDLIDNKDVALIKVLTDASLPGRKQFAIFYVNLRDPAVDPRYPLQNATKALV